jgi:hypothetical protein
MSFLRLKRLKNSYKNGFFAVFAEKKDIREE